MVHQEVMVLRPTRMATGTELPVMRETEVATDRELELLPGLMVALRRPLDQVAGVAVGRANAAVLIQVKVAQGRIRAPRAEMPTAELRLRCYSTLKPKRDLALAQVRPQLRGRVKAIRSSTTVIRSTSIRVVVPAGSHTKKQWLEATLYPGSECRRFWAYILVHQLRSRAPPVQE